MTSRRLLAFASLAALAVAAHAAPPAAKSSVTSSRLLLPLYQVQAGNPSGTTTLFAVRNDGLNMVSVSVEYYETDGPQAPQRTDVFLLGPKQIRTVNIRDVNNLEVDDDGFARGYVILEGPSGSTLQGDYFVVTPGDAFATGDRLVNIDGASTGSDLCSSFAVRFLQGGPFTGGTKFFLWLDTDTVPTNPSAISYSVYDEAGDLIFTNTLPIDRVALGIDAGQLLSPFTVNFGALELQLNDGLEGHLAATLSASGLYSLGLAATCLD